MTSTKKKKISPVREIEFSMLQRMFTIRSEFIVRSYSHPVKRKKDGSYSIRVVKSAMVGFMGNTATISWDYFELDKNKIITKCPRGYTPDYKGKKIYDIEDFVDWEIKI